MISVVPPTKLVHNFYIGHTDSVEPQLEIEKLRGKKEKAKPSEDLYSSTCCIPVSGEVIAIVLPGEYWQYSFVHLCPTALESR